MAKPEELWSLNTLGYVVLEGLAGEDRLKALRRRVEELFEEEGENAGHEFRSEPFARRLDNLVDKGEVFESVIAEPRVLELVRHVLPGGFKLSGLNARSTNPYAAQPQPLHVDMGLLPDARGPAACNSIWLLDDFTAGIGAARFVPGSHLSGRNPHDTLADPLASHLDEVLVLAPAGAVVVYNAHVWHGSTANHTAMHRRALHSFYVRRDLPQRQWQKKLLRPETQARLSPAMRDLLALDDALNGELPAAAAAMSGFVPPRP
jgi:ectoine hydroxylase-related dioxygenase (phytanoyl-CoA dioxygenase family)